MPGKDHIRFIADVMVGRLAKYLRMAGYDVVYMNDADDSQILDIARGEDRIVLTRDTLMLQRREFNKGTLKSVYIKDDNLEKQLIQIKSEMGIELRPDLIICLVCNGSLEEADKADIEGDVPPYVYRTQDNFKFCKNCGKYYWRGTHYDYIKKYFDGLEKIS